MIKNLHLMAIFLPEHADLVCNRSIVSFSIDFE